MKKPKKSAPSINYLLPDGTVTRDKKQFEAARRAIKKKRLRPNGYPIYQGPGYVTRTARTKAVVEKLTIERVPFGTPDTDVYYLTVMLDDKSFVRELEFGSTVEVVAKPRPKKN